MHHLRVDEQSTYVDVYCDGFVVRVDKANNAGGEMLVVYDPTLTEKWFNDATQLYDGSNGYQLGYDNARSTVVLENTPTRVVIRVIGNWDRTSGSTDDYKANSTSLEIIYTIYSDRFTTKVKWITSDAISSSGNMTLCGISNQNEGNLTGIDGNYGEFGSETPTSTNTYYDNKDYIMWTSDQVTVMSVLLDSPLGYAYATGFGFRTWSTNVARAMPRTEYVPTGAETIELLAMTIIDTPDREGSARIYDETDRLVMGAQYKDLKIAAAGLAEGSRVFDDGSDQYLAHAEAVITEAPLTMSCFFNVNDAAINHGLMGIARTDSDLDIFYLIAAGVETGEPVRVAINDGTWAAANTTTNWSVDTWHHAAAVFASPTSRSVYLDGGGKATDSTSKTPADQNSTSIGGLLRTSLAEPTSGKIAHAAIWNIDLSDDEVKLLSEGADPRSIRPEALVAYWPLIDDDKDIVGGYDMTPINSPTWSTTDFPNVYLPDKGRYVNDLNLPATILESGSGFTADGAWHTSPVSPREKPSHEGEVKPSTAVAELNTEHPLAEGLELAVLLNEESGASVADLSSNGLTGTITDALWVAGGLNFDQSDNSNVVIINGSNGVGHPLDFTDGPFTIITSIKPSAIDGTIIGKRDDTDDQFQLYIQTGDGNLIFRAGSEEGGAIGIDAIPQNETSVVGVVVDASNNPEVYRNGAKLPWSNVAGSRPFVFTHRDVSVSIGARWQSEPTTGFEYNGDINWVLIFSRALSDNEMAQVASFPFEMFVPAKDTLKSELDVAGGIAEDLMLAMLLNEGTGATIINQANDYSGTAIGTGLSWVNRGLSFGDGADYISIDTGFLADHLAGKAGFSFVAFANFGTDTSQTFIELLRNGDNSRVRFDSDYISNGIRFGGRSADESFKVFTDGRDISDGNDHVLAGYFDLPDDEIGVYVDGVWDTSGVSFSADTFAAGEGSHHIICNTSAHNVSIEGGTLYYIFMWARRLTTEEFNFVVNNPYYMFGEAGKVKLTMDRTRIRPAIVLDDLPFFTGDPINPTDHLLNHLRLNDNAASAVLEAEVGPDGVWRAVSGPADRDTNTAGDSVQEIGRGRNLDTQDGTSYIELAVGAGTVHDNAFFKKGSALLKIKPQFAFDTADSQHIFNLAFNASNRFMLNYWPITGEIQFATEWGTIVDYPVSGVFTDNGSLQREMTILMSWDSDNDFILLAIDGKVSEVVRNTGTPTASEPIQCFVGLRYTDTLPADIIIDEIKTLNEAILPYGAYFTGNGAVDTDEAHKDILTYVKGDEATTDSLQIGTGVVTIVNATKTTDVQGNADSAFLFNGSGKYAQFPAPGNIDFTKGSIGFWVKHEATVDPFARYFTTVTDNNEFIIHRFNTNDIRWRISGNNIDFTGVFGTYLDDENWHWVVFVWDEDTPRRQVFVDGVSRGTDATAFTAPTMASQILRVGEGDVPTGNELTGIMCDIYITNNPDTPQIWTAFGKPLHLPLVNKE